MGRFIPANRIPKIQMKVFSYSIDLPAIRRYVTIQNVVITCRYFWQVFAFEKLVSEHNFAIWCITYPILVGEGGGITPPTAYIENLKNWCGPKANNKFYFSKIKMCSDVK